MKIHPTLTSILAGTLTSMALAACEPTHKPAEKPQPSIVQPVPRPPQEPAPIVRSVPCEPEITTRPIERTTKTIYDLPTIDIEFGSVTNEQTELCINAVKIYNDFYYPVRNIYRETGELSFMFIRHGNSLAPTEADARLRLSPLDKKFGGAEILSDFVFIPTQYSENGYPINAVPYPTNGPFAIRAPLTLPQINAPTGKVRLNEQSLPFAIPFLKMEGMEYYFPPENANATQTDPNSLPFYLFYLSTAEPEIQFSNGQVTLHDPQFGAFKPVAVPLLEYKKRFSTKIGTISPFTMRKHPCQPLGTIE